MNEVQVPISFFNDFQREFFNATLRNQCFSGGFGNGKTYVGCQKAAILLLRFKNYRFAIVRKAYSDLKRTTMQTFFKIVPPQAILRHSEQEGVTDLINGSRVYWLHSDKFDESTLRGLEINSCLVDQAEEIEESIYLILDSRIGRWDKAEVPPDLVTQNWPRHGITGRYLVPNYNLILCNPEHVLHWIYQKFHPESDIREPDHFFINAPTDPNAYDPLTYQQMLKRDPEWVAKYVRGEWGASSAQIHNVLPDSIIKDPPAAFIERLKKKAALYRVLDHGDSSPTCCVWYACLDGCYIAYREYYVPGDVISNHRRAISDLSEGEYYCGNYADPSIFHTASQRDGGFWSVADEYLDSHLNSATISWMPADNNEFANRNRINELLLRNPSVKHPITGQLNSPKLYFIVRTADYPQGIIHTIQQTKMARRESLGTFNGKMIFSDERAKAVEDHAYDTLRYFVSVHGASRSEPRRPIPPNSFLGLRKSIKKMRQIMQLQGRN